MNILQYHLCNIKKCIDFLWMDGRETDNCGGDGGQEWERTFHYISLFDILKKFFYHVHALPTQNIKELEN